jgi:phosphoribosylformylglycinamidine synthase subunit PurQ / glutaminase
MPVRALILHANGSNRDREAAQALQLAGAVPEIVHLNQLRARTHRWDDYQLLVVPGGFSYADALGAGKLLALDLNAYFADEVRAFVHSGRPVIGICNGFQALVKAGLLPGSRNSTPPAATLTFNAAGRFECRWVSLLPQSQQCVWTRDLAEPMYCPVAHGEGNFVAAEPSVIEALRAYDQIALVYAGPDGVSAGGTYPYNPNGSAADIAGVCNPAGNVLGLMPHPENHLFTYQHPRWTRGESAGLGLPLFVNGVRYAEGL